MSGAARGRRFVGTATMVWCAAWSAAAPVPSSEPGEATDRGSRELDVPASLVAAEPDPVVRGMLASAFFARCIAGGRQALAEGQKLLPDYVPVMARGGDPSCAPSVQAVARSHFAREDGVGCLSLRGPRLRVGPPNEIATRVNRGTFAALETVASPFLPATSDAGGAFLCTGSQAGPAVAMCTAFVAASRVIDAAERWTGHRVPWGQDGRLVVEAYGSVTDLPLAYFDQTRAQVTLGALGRVDPEDGIGGYTGRPWGWSREVSDLLLESAGDPDVAAHEAGHAVVAALKPGWGAGVALVLHEAIADCFAVLTAMEDPAVVGRVMRATGGALRRRNEFTELFEGIGGALHAHADADPANDGERTYRSALAEVRLADCELSPEAVDMPATLSVAGPSADPHVAAQVVTGALYDLFSAAYERERGAGAGIVRAVVRAHDEAGAVMLRSFRFLGEHRVSLEDLALAMLCADSELSGSRNRGALLDSLRRRGLLRAGSARAEELVGAGRDLPAFRLHPGLSEPASILARVEELESMLLALLRDPDSPGPGPIRHNGPPLFAEEVAMAGLHLWSDLTAADGVRTIRLRYRVSAGRIFAPAGNGPRVDEYLAPGADPGTVDVFTSLLFDRHGNLVGLHTDRPWR